MKSNPFIKVILGAFLLSILFALSDFALGISPPKNSYVWGILSSIFVASVLGYLILHSTYRGFKLSVIVFIVYFIIGQFNILIEALIFNVTDRSTTIYEIIRGFIVILFFAPIFVYLLEKWEGQSTQLSFAPRSIFSWIRKIALVDVLYFTIYVTAGMIIQATYPNFMDFYEGKIPPLDLVLTTQVFRGILFAAIAILVTRTTDLNLTKRMILVGLLFSILGGIAPLIPPNEFMPFHTRMAHGIEVGISNFLFGVIAGYLLGQKRKDIN